MALSTSSHHSSDLFPNLFSYFQRFATEDAKPLLERLWTLLFGDKHTPGAFALLPCVFLWRGLAVVHAGPALGEGDNAASSSEQAEPQVAQRLMQKQLFGHLWQDPADCPEVSVLVGACNGGGVGVWGEGVCKYSKGLENLYWVSSCHWHSHHTDIIVDHGICCTCDLQVQNRFTLMRKYLQLQPCL